MFFFCKYCYFFFCHIIKSLSIKYVNQNFKYCNVFVAKLKKNKQITKKKNLRGKQSCNIINKKYKCYKAERNNYKSYLFLRSFFEIYHKTLLHSIFIQRPQEKNEILQHVKDNGDKEI